MNITMKIVLLLLCFIFVVDCHDKSFTVVGSGKSQKRNEVCSDPSKRFGIMCQIAAKHGSTALQQFLMSSGSLANICAALGWECEEKGNFVTITGKLTVEAEMTELFKYFNDADTSKLLTIFKGAMPSNTNIGPWYDKIVNQEDQNRFLSHALQYTKLFSNINSGNHTVSQDLQTALDVSKMSYVEPSYIILWRPICLYSLSSSYRRIAADFNITFLLKLELSNLQYAVGTVDSLLSNPLVDPVDIFVVNYGSFLWQREETQTRFEHFFPCSKFDFDYVPSEDLFYPENRWKVQGSIASFADAHPAEDFGYNPVAATCDRFKIPAFRALTKEDRLLYKRIQAAQAYLQVFSI